MKIISILEIILIVSKLLPFTWRSKMSDVSKITVGHLKEIWKQKNVSDDDPISFYCTGLTTEIELGGVYKKLNEGEGILMEFQPSIIEEKEDDDDDDDDEYGDDYEPSDQDMMAAFGTKWHDGL